MEEKKNNLGIIKELIPLFAFEIVLLTLFNFANLSVVYRVMAVVVASVAVIPIIKSMPRDKSIIPLVLQIGSIFLYLLLSVTFGHIATQNIFTIIVIVLGGIGFYIIGIYYGVFKEKKVDISKLLSAFYLGIGLFTIVSLIATLYGIGTPFYAVIFLNPDNAIRRELVDRARIIIDIFRDLDFTYATPNNFGVAILANFALLSASGFYVTILTNMKDNKFLWLSSLIGGICGLLTIILIPIFFDLIIFIFGLVLTILLKNKSKITKYYFIYLGVSALVLGVLYMVFRIDNHLHPEHYEDLNYILEAILFQKIGIFKYFANLKYFLSLPPKIVGSSIGAEFSYISSGTIITDVLYQSGILPLICLLLFMGVGIIELVKYLKSDDNLNVKVGITSLILFFVISLIINYVGILLTESFVFLGIIMLFAYVVGYNLRSKKSLIKQEVVKENKEKEAITND